MRSRVRLAALLVGIFVAAWLGLLTVGGASGAPTVWPAAGLASGLYLTSPARRRPGVLALTLLLMVAAHLLHGYDAAAAFGFGVSSVASVWVVRHVLVGRRTAQRVALMDQGDVSRMIGAIAAGSLVAGAGYGLTDLLLGRGHAGLSVLASAGAHAAAIMILLPLFLETVSHRALATTGERAVQLVITVVTTIVVFVPTGAPQLIFAVMPMFTWHAFRGSLRESTIVLTVVGVIGTVFTASGLGPVHAAVDMLDIAPELALGVLQLFLLDCGLILLPLSVMVTQQRRAVDRADQERDTLESLVDAATGTAVIATDANGKVTLFNPGAEKILGRSAQDVVGRAPDDLFGQEELHRHGAAVHAPATFAEIAGAMVGLGVRSRLWQVRRPSGDERTIRMTLTAIPNASGVFCGYLATAEDVTERESAHRALLATLEHERNAVEQLRELERTKGDFVATVSHELRTPITSIMGYTEVLEDGAYGELTQDQLEVLGRVDRNSRRLLLLVEDLLTLSNIEASTMKLDIAETDLRAVVGDAGDSLAALLVGRELLVRYHVPSEPVHHRADARQLERMLLNLLTNAVKFTPDGGVIDVFLHDDSELRQIVVRDSGLGIPLVEQAHLFTRFFRSTTATENAIQGTGLGLTIVKGIVTLHGGQIEMSSEPKVGTTVTVTLPRFTDALPPAPSSRDGQVGSIRPVKLGAPPRTPDAHLHTISSAPRSEVVTR
nr:ATP-binding protein [Nocardioides aurantiacus]